MENLIAAAPGATPMFYRTSAGAEIDLLLETPREGLWAIEIKLGLSTRPRRGFHLACEDLKPARRFVVHAGSGREAIAEGTEAMGVREMMETMSRRGHY